MIGGNGSDTYVVDNVGDVIIETNPLAAGGNDLVLSSIDYTLGTSSNLERLTLTGTGDINGTGNELSNTITGNSGNNILDGGVGGIDTLKGGLGDDTYIVDLTATGALQDHIIEAANAGNDTIQLRGTSTNVTAATITLSATLENLDASLTGSSKLNLTGNALNNTLIGNDADNVLKGGAGNDTLTGGAGNDKFYFSSPVNGTTNIDTITDFTVGQDSIQLSKAIFTKVGAAGSLSADYFYAGNAAHDANDHVIYDASTGALYYDVDGTGAAAQVQIATLSNTPTITNADFIVSV